MLRCRVWCIQRRRRKEQTRSSEVTYDRWEICHPSERPMKAALSAAASSVRAMFRISVSSFFFITPHHTSSCLRQRASVLPWLTWPHAINHSSILGGWKEARLETIINATELGCSRPQWPGRPASSMDCVPGRQVAHPRRFNTSIRPATWRVINIGGLLTLFASQRVHARSESTSSKQGRQDVRKVRSNRSAIELLLETRHTTLRIVYCSVNELVHRYINI